MRTLMWTSDNQQVSCKITHSDSLDQTFYSFSLFLSNSAQRPLNKNHVLLGPDSQELRSDLVCPHPQDFQQVSEFPASFFVSLKETEWTRQKKVNILTKVWSKDSKLWVWSLPHTAEALFLFFMHVYGLVSLNRLWPNSRFNSTSEWVISKKKGQTACLQPHVIGTVNNAL